MITLNLRKIKEHLHLSGVESEIQEETDQLCVILKLHEQEFPLFIRVYDDGELLQLIAFFPYTIKESAFGDVARLLHLLNKEIDIPGFGMDETTAVTFFRVMIPAENKKVGAKLFDAYLGSIQMVCQSFAPVVAGIGSGMMTFEEMLRKTKEHGGSLTKLQMEPK
ncbi:MAG: YbjN domain-containing protein [Parachlamydiaceae bacterium]